MHFGGHRFCTYVANDAVCVAKRWFFFPFPNYFYLKHFFFVTSQQGKKQCKYLKYADKMHVVKVCTAMDSWGFLLVSMSVFNKGLCDEDHWQFDWLELIQSLIHPVSDYRSAGFVQKQSHEETTVLMPIRTGH